ncbi:MAG: MarC family protein [Gammaproteobacteria bacterium]|nr:MarC family protein [Gammaproteobacteria bacterium]MDH5727780.1 MarC family protein [Gammaproteobacteria bacterium]
MLELAISTFVVLVVVIDPVGVAPIFGALTQHASQTYRRTMARRGVLLSFLILVFFSFAGHLLLTALGISMQAFKVAGGFFLFLLSIDMVFARQSGLRSTTPKETHEAEHADDISVFPLAIPLLAGPGAMTTLVLMMGEAAGRIEHISIIMAILTLVLVLVYAALMSAAVIMKILGEIGTNVVSRILGILLAALAVQYMIDGIRSSFALT